MNVMTAAPELPFSFAVHESARRAVHEVKGQCTIEARAHVWVMELKRDGTAAEALAQIEKRGYAAPFAADPRQLHLIGASFDSRTRLLADWEER